MALNPRGTVDDLVWYLTDECRRRRAAYQSGMRIQLANLRRRVAATKRETGNTPVGKTRESLAYFVASNLAPVYGEE